MLETDIHNMNIAYDDTNFHTSHFVAHLKNEKMRAKMLEYCDRALKSFDFGIEVKDNKGYDYILKNIGENKFNLSIKLK